MLRRLWLPCAACLVVALAGAVRAQDQPLATNQEAGAPPAAVLPHEVVVVTPCRDCSAPVVNSPAAVSVIPAASIATAADPSLPELLRMAPGLHVVRYSTRQYEATGRQATANLANSQLVLLDGRSLYLDFIGAILWDFVSVDAEDVQQIEVVRGPASAVWGANAFTGVVNVITKSPRQAPASSLTLTAGSFNRDAGSTAGLGPGLTYGFRASLSRPLGPKLAAGASVGYHSSDALPRPVGLLPVVPHPLAPDQLVGGGVLPDDRDAPGAFRNRGTTQPRADLRIDQQAGGSRISYSAGIAGSEGLVHTGIGPFALERGAYFGYGRVVLSRGRLSLGAFANVFGANAPNLLAQDAEGQPVRLDVQARTYDVSAGWSKPVGSRGVLTVGGNARHNSADATLAPGAESRTELGAYAQGEYFLGGDEGPEWRIAAGSRLDRFANLAHLVLSPRLSLIWKPGPNHSVRCSVNRAFRAPTIMDNYLEQSSLQPVTIPGLPEDFPLVVYGVGNRGLRQESLTAWELGYIGTISGRTTLGVNLFLNDTRDNINFMRLPNDFDPYTEAEPPPGWPLPPALLAALAAQGVFLPRTASQFTNLGPIRHRGIEAFAEHRFGDGVTGYVNYSWQPDPRPLPAPEPYPAVEVQIAPRNRVNAGLYWSGRRVTGSLGLSSSDPAFWVDVLPHDYDGWSPAYTMFNASLGLRWAEGRLVTVLRGTNLTNAEVRQHVYGDVVKRTIWAETRFSF